jgi:hypothetical protein
MVGVGVSLAFQATNAVTSVVVRPRSGGQHVYSATPCRGARHEFAKLSLNLTGRRLNDAPCADAGEKNHD